MRFSAVWSKSLVLAGMLVGWSSVASAQTYWLDFGDGSTTPAGNWNLISNAGIHTSAALIDSDGSSSDGVTFQITDDWINNGASQTGVAQDRAWAPLIATQDYFVLDPAPAVNNTTAAFQFNDLDDNQTYSIELVATRSSSSGQREVNATANGMIASNNGLTINNEFNGKVIIWESLTPVGGTITMDFSMPPGATFAYINALQLSAVVPEPATLGLLLPASLCFLRRRRHHA